MVSILCASCLCRVLLHEKKSKDLLQQISVLLQGCYAHYKYRQYRPVSHVEGFSGALYPTTKHGRTVHTFARETPRSPYWLLFNCLSVELCVDYIRCVPTSFARLQKYFVSCSNTSNMHRAFRTSDLRMYQTNSDIWGSCSSHVSADDEPSPCGVDVMCACVCCGFLAAVVVLLWA